MTMEMNEEQLAGAEVCFAVASQLLYVEPTVEGVAQQAAARQFANAPFGEGNPFAKRGLELMNAWCDTALTDANVSGDGEEAERAVAVSWSFQEEVAGLRREWLRLFAGVGEPQASCLESYYVEPNSHMFGKNTLAVREAYRAHGLQIEKLYSEPDDHLGLMLGFMAHLIGEELDVRAAGDESAAEAVVRDQDDFLTEHMLPWLATWRYLVEKHAASDYFRGVGDFVFGLCTCYAERFGIRFDEESNTFKRSAS